MSGDSSFATCLTSSNPTVAAAPPVMVAVDAESHSNGTSTPCTFLPSLRTYLMWIRLIVTSLLLVGCVSEPGGPGSFSTRRSWALPTSLNTVGHGLSVVQGAGVVMFVITSDNRLATSVV